MVQSGWAKSPDGSYTYTVTATDAAGNVGSASVTYTIDDVGSSGDNFGSNKRCLLSDG